jgi:DNA helicase-2/ATP-dependent DNA helicase PcrA
MIKNERLFLDRYHKLNERQRAAVDTTEGPVMVIAGPGTGKTEILSMRIANLLRSEAQVKPYEILCLTYTDEGSVAMRKRLLQIIGEEAHRVHIFTFHAFCNSLIQSNAEYFGLRDLQPVSDLERAEILHDILEELPEGNILRRLKGNIYYDAQNLHSLFDLMKTEDWLPEEVELAIKAYLASLPEREAFLYKRANAKQGIKAGDVKQKDIDKETARMERTLAAAKLFPVYQSRMQALGRYDFSDMILWVLNAFKENEDFLRNYQERFQYVLVDEFQDTSGSQSELLTSLMDFWNSPNIFIVGDDDQSIFEFQGARLKNIVDFYTRYEQDIKVIVLKENYRSSQDILDKAMKLIDHNQERLIVKLKSLGLDKNIMSAHPRFTAEEPVKPVLKAYHNILHEEADIVQQIETLQMQGVDLSNVAILYSQHKQASNILELMERKGIPYWVKRPVNVLDLPMIQQLINMLKYIESEQRKPFSGETFLFELLHVPQLGILPVDLAHLSLYKQEKDTKHKFWRFLLLDNLLLQTLGLETATALNRIGVAIEDWLQQAKNLTIPMLLEKILYDTGLMANILKGDNQVWDMQVLHTFFNFAKEECARQPRITVSGFLGVINEMQIEGLTVPVQKVVRQENGVRFYTAFSAKGHEFEYVFLIGVTKNFWEKKRGASRGFNLPDTLTQTGDSEENSATEEVMRRVFFVALTRAKKYLQISYALKDNAGKDLEASQFVDELGADEKQMAEQQLSFVSTEQVMEYLHWAFVPAPPVQITLAKKELLENRLERFVMSASALNKYLKCPIAFYYETILQVPVAKNDSMAFGTAIHYALEKLFKKMIDDPDKQFPSKEEMIQDFERMLWRHEDAFTEIQYKRRKELGANILTEYYDHYIGSFNKIVVIERMLGNMEVAGVPVKGKLDKIEFEGNECTVVDYKTGNPEYSKKKELLPPNEGNPNGGDYWRQMVFYRILLDNNPYAQAQNWHMKEGLFDYIEKNDAGDFVRHTVPITPADLLTVIEQIKDTDKRIRNQEFDRGCNEPDCAWCNFVKTHELVKPVIEEDRL